MGFIISEETGPGGLKWLSSRQFAGLLPASNVLAQQAYCNP